MCPRGAELATARQSPSGHCRWLLRARFPTSLAEKSRLNLQIDFSPQSGCSEQICCRHCHLWCLLVRRIPPQTALGTRASMCWLPVIGAAKQVSQATVGQHLQPVEQQQSATARGPL